MDILDEILLALEAEDRVMLATIISTSGSTPAAALSKMLVKGGGTKWVGTVGGGCMEGDVLHHARSLYEADKAGILAFHLNEDSFDQGLICGGSLDVLVEPLTRKDIPLIRLLKAIRDEGEDCVVATLLRSDGYVERKLAVGVHTFRSSQAGDEITVSPSQLRSFFPDVQDDLEEAAQRVYRRQETRRLRTNQGELILEPMAGCPALIIFGAGHVSRYLSRAASMAGFRVTVVDDRREYANAQRFPEAAQTMAVEFYEAFARLTIKPSTYIVIVTRGHRSDEEILEYAVSTQARYIGMIGSKRKVLTTYQHIAARGTAIESLERVHAPIGIEIGAVTAEEIAISIVGELVRVRRGASDALPHKSEAMKPHLTDLQQSLQSHIPE